MTAENKGFTLQVFDGTHYDKWRFKLKLFLELKECLEVIENDERPTTIKEEDWKMKEIKAKNIIVNSIMNTQLELIISEKTAKKMIEKLDENYLIKSSAVKLMCKRKLLDLKMEENENPTDFFNNFEKLVNELKNAGEDVTKEDKLNYFLLTLPESMSHIVDVVDALPEKDKTVEYVKSKLALDFQKRHSGDNFRKDSQAFAPKGSYGNKNSKMQNFKKKNNSQEQNKNQVGKCFKCVKLGHIARFCRSKVPQQSNNNDSSRVAGSSKVLEDGSSTFNVEVLTTSAHMSQKPEDNYMKWLLDSGCSDHIVNSDKYFYESVSLKNQINIKVGDGFSLKSEKIGNIKSLFEVNGKVTQITIKNVYYVPNMKKNLLSVSNMVNHKNYIIFENNFAKVYNSSKELVAIAEKAGKLYNLQCEVIKTENSKQEVYNSSIEMSSKEKWHRTLGHTNFKVLDDLCNNKLLDGLPNKISDEFLKCEICLENKMSRLSFKNERRKANDILEIIHTDVHGPITQLGYEGEKLFVTFIDDYSKIAKVYCIKSKNEVYDKFVEYINLVQNSTGKKIKEIHCDNGTEYINKRFLDLAKKEGIYIRPCPPYTHQLNGVAERYNRTIMDRARCLIAEANLDKRYWPIFVETAAYLGNRVLANTKLKKTPYEIFFGRKPDVSNLHIIGSKAFIINERRTSKLNPKAVKGILVGYTDLGYKVLVEGKLIITRNVRFVDKNEKTIQSNLDLDYDEHEQSENSENSDYENPVEEENEKVESPELDEEKDGPKAEEVLNLRKSERQRKLPEKLNDYVLYANFCNVDVPENYKEAVSCQDSRKWKVAMNDEINSLESNETWKIVDEPTDKKIIEVKWIYRKKSDGKFQSSSSG